MTDETNVPAASSAPAEGQTTPTPETNTPSQPEQGKPENETEATANSTGETQDAADSERSDDADDAESDGEDRKPSRSRSARQRRKIELLSNEIAELRSRIDTSSQSAESKSKEPKESDFPGDYFAYQAAKQAYDTRNAVNEAIEGQERRAREARLQDMRREQQAEFMEGIAQIKPRIPDFDQVMNSANVELRQDVTDLILSSEKGPHLAYELAKENCKKAREVNAMTPIEAARYVGRLEARLSLPSPKKLTQAPPPIKSPSGGASPSRDLASLAKSEDISDFIAASRAKQRA